MTIKELIKASLRAIGAIDPHETPTNRELADALEALNMMLENWFIEGISVYAGTEENFTLTGSDNEYTIGSGGDFDTARPYRITGAFIRSSNKDYPIDIISPPEFNRLFNKSRSGRPYKLNYLPESPLGKVRLYFTPDSAYDLHIQSQKPLSEITSLDATITFDQGFKAAIKWNLGLELAPEWGTSPGEVVVARAESTLDRLLSLNAARDAEPIRLNLLGEGGSYDHTTDSYT